RNTANKTLWTTLADETDPIILHENDGIAGHTIKEGKPLLINDPYHDDHFLPSNNNKTGFITENIASIPIFGFRTPYYRSDTTAQQIQR
ncbi:MAG: hypothetical protein ACXWB0_06345, partial [Sulfuricurvum sp.]